MTDLVLITDTLSLAAFCDHAHSADFVTVDTEFMRESTYYAQLCLIQLATTSQAVAVDPMAAGLSLAPLFALFNNPDVLKVFHAGSQDLEIFYQLSAQYPAQDQPPGWLPHPVFDTQIAAMALGLGEQIGYANLVESLLGVSLSKAARFTDWAKRPLEPRQLEYALGDVTYLAKLFPKMLEKLRQKNRGHWLNEEMERLVDPATYTVDPDQLWRRIRPPSRRADVLGRLKALAAWREREAQEKDIPRGRVLKDESLSDLALTPPSAQDKLKNVRGVPENWARSDIGARLMAVLTNAPPLPATEMPDREDGLVRSKQGALIADLLKLLLKIRSNDMKVAAKLICRGDDLDALAAGVREGLSILSGWRYDVFGVDALDLVEGRLGFSACQGQLQLTRLDQEKTAPCASPQNG